MATKLYLHAATSSVTGTLPTDEQSTLTPDANDFEGSRTTNRTMNTTIGVSQANLTNTSTADTAAHNYYISRWVSPLIYQAKVDANTWTVEYAAKEANAAANFPRSSTGVMYVNCYVWKPSTGTKVGTILDGNSNADGEEAGTTQTVINYTFTGAAVTGITPGDAVIVYELWAQVTQGNGTARVQDVYYDGTTENSTTNEAAYLSTPESLIFTKSSSENTTTVTAGGPSVTSTANTTQYWPIAGRAFATTTEAEVKIPIRTAGTLSNLVVRLHNNGIAGATTFTVMKNGVATSLVATATASTTGVYEDVTNTVSVSAGDLIDIKSVPGAALGTFQTTNMTLDFTPTTPTNMVTIAAAADSDTYASASSTTYIQPYGYAGNNGTETNAKMKMKKAGTISNFAVYVQSNSRTTNTIFKTRKNGVDGTCTVTFASGETGLKEDTTHSDSFAVDDDFNYAITTSTGTETITYLLVKSEYTSTGYNAFVGTASAGGSSLAAAATTNYAFGGGLNGQATETNIKRRIRNTKMLISNLQVVVTANTVAANSTAKLRVNGVDSALSTTITANTAGTYTDTTNIVTVGSNDDLDIQMIAGAGGTSMTIRSISVTYTTGRISQASILKYNLIGRISRSRTYLYNVLGRISLSRIYKYNIAESLTRISKSQIYKYHVANLVSLSRIYKYNVIGRISLSRVYKYNANARVSLSRIYKYNTNARVSRSRTYLYNVLSRVSLSRIYKSHIVGRVSLSRVYKYHLLGRISLARIYLYHLVGRISQSKTYKYNILGRVSLSRTYLFNVLQRISLSRVYKYHVANLVSLSRTYKYHLLGRVSLSRSYLWNLLGRVSKSSTYKYNIIGRVSLARSYLYNVLGRISKSSTLKYNVIQRISVSKTYLWNLVESLLERVSKSQVYKWNMNARVTLSHVYKYNILYRVSLSRTYLYHLQSRVSLSRSYLYSVIGRISLSRIYKYNLLSRVSLSRVYKYNILQHISLAKTYLWNVLVDAPLERISKSQVYKYNVLGRISLTRQYLYHIQGRISLSRVYRFSLLNKVSLQRTYKYHITTLVSKTSIFKYNVISRVSLSRVYRWALGLVTTVREGSITGRTESRVSSGLPFDKWRSYLHRPERPRRHSSSRFPRG